MCLAPHDEHAYKCHFLKRGLRVSFRSLSVAVLVAWLCLPGRSEGREFGMVRGLLRAESARDELQGAVVGGSSTTELGARLGFYWQNDWDVLVGVVVSAKFYEAAPGVTAPAPSVATTLSAGLRKYVALPSTFVSPFGSGTVSLTHGGSSSVSAASPATAGYSDKKLTGLYYGCDVGLRAVLAEVWWVDLEVPLFVSVLTESTTVTQRDASGAVLSKIKTTRTELFGSSDAPITGAKIVVGRKF